MTSSEAYVTLSLFETTPKQFVESSKPCAGEKMKVEFHGRRKKKNLQLLLLTRQPLCGPEGKHVLTLTHLHGLDDGLLPCSVYNSMKPTPNVQETDGEPARQTEPRTQP